MSTAVATPLGFARNIVTPTGTILSAQDISLILELGATGFVSRHERPVTLSSGRRSRIYVHGREDLTDNPLALRTLGSAIARFMRTTFISTGRTGERRLGIIPIPTAATKLATAAAFEDAMRFGVRSIFFRTMRTEKKRHGAENNKDRWIDGTPDVGAHFYVGLEQVTTTAGSLLTHVAHMADDGYPVASMPFVIVANRGRDTIRVLEAAGIREAHIMYELLDMVYVLSQWGGWPEDAYREAESE